jgi:hypothetical protein
MVFSTCQYFATLEATFEDFLFSFSLGGFSHIIDRTITQSSRSHLTEFKSRHILAIFKKKLRHCPCGIELCGEMSIYKGGYNYTGSSQDRPIDDSQGKCNQAAQASNLLYINLNLREILHCLFPSRS